MYFLQYRTCLSLQFCGAWNPYFIAFISMSELSNWLPWLPGWLAGHSNYLIIKPNMKCSQSSFVRMNATTMVMRLLRLRPQKRNPSSCNCQDNGTFSLKSWAAIDSTRRYNIPHMPISPWPIQLVQIVCECELSTVFNFGGLVPVPHAMDSKTGKRKTAMHFDHLDSHYYYLAAHPSIPGSWLATQQANKLTCHVLLFWVLCSGFWPLGQSPEMSRKGSSHR